MPAGPVLTVRKSTVDPILLDLSWGESCSTGAFDYSVREGEIGSWFINWPPSVFTASYDYDAPPCSYGLSCSVQDPKPSADSKGIYRASNSSSAPIQSVDGDHRHTQMYPRSMDPTVHPR